MELRKHLLGGQAGVGLVVLVTAFMAVFALQKTADRAAHAGSHAFEDIVLLERARAQVADLTDATRSYLVGREEGQRAALGDLQKRLEPTIDQLTVRAQELAVPEAWRIERDADAYVAWLSHAAADGLTVEPFERVRADRRAALDAELNAFAVAARRHSAETLDSAKALAHRAQLGVVFTSMIALVVAFVLAASVMQKVTVQVRRLRIATNLANRTAASRKELLEILAADLRSATNASGLSMSLLDERRIAESERLHLTRLRSALRRIDHVVDSISDAADILAMDSIELRYARFNTRTLLGTCIDMFLGRAKEHGVHIKTDSRDIVTVNADPERIVQVFANLIMYSLQRSELGGIITLSVTPQPSGVRFAVTDSGPLIDSDARSRLFSRDRTSTGVALDVCRRLIEAHGGEMGVDSKPDKTSFWFVIPP